MSLILGRNNAPDEIIPDDKEAQLMGSRLRADTWAYWNHAQAIRRDPALAKSVGSGKQLTRISLRTKSERLRKRITKMQNEIPAARSHNAVVETKPDRA